MTLLRTILSFFFGSFPSFIASYWQPIASAIFTAAICYNMHACVMVKANHDRAEAVAEEKRQNDNDCQAAKLFTGGNSNEYQADLSHDLSDNDSRYNSIVMRNGGETSSTCIPITRRGSGLDASGEEGKNGIAANGIPIVAILGIVKHQDDRYASASRKLEACQRHAAEIERIGLNCH